MIAWVSARPASTHAQDRWSTPFPGVRHLVRQAPGPRVIHALKIDLCAAGISFRATRSGERRATVPAFATSVGAEAAVNGDFFSYTDYSPSGAAVGRGARWGPPDSRTSGFLAFGSDAVQLSAPREVVDPLPAWMSEVVGGHPMVLQGGEVVDYPATAEFCTTRHPRTVAGLSEDRQTLVLAVIDGRSSSSIGMGCEEAGALMRGLGAHDALNLDGGGSSTMWIRGPGVVNVPSDGRPRVVGNHLAIHATGRGVPAACRPWEPDELALEAPLLDARATTDLDGDGRADVCARSAAGIVCALADGRPFGEITPGPELSDARGWDALRYFSTLATGDVNGDGRADLCARTASDVRCWPSTGAGFAEPWSGPPLSDATGWAAPEHRGTLRLADVDGDGLDDVCGRAAAGLRCWRSTGRGFEAAGTPVLAALSNAEGWAAEARWSSIRMGDVDGDRRADVCARSADGIDCFLSTGHGFDAAAVAGPRWTDAAGWSAPAQGRSVRLVDLDGDGRDDVCGRAAAGLVCHLASGRGFGPAITLAALSDARGWSDPANHSTLRFADLDGDSDLDVCGRSDDGIRCWPFDGAGFGEAFSGPALSDDEGWAHAAYHRSLRFADVDGDGDEDLCARGRDGLTCWPSEGAGFGEAQQGPRWSDADGWLALSRHATLRLSGPRRARPVVDHGDGGIPGADAATGLDASGGPLDGASPATCACRAASGRARAPWSSSLAALAGVCAWFRRRRRTRVPLPGARPSGGLAKPTRPGHHRG